MSRKAMIFRGGWDGHEPKKVSERFKKLLEKEDFEVDIFDTQECLAETEPLLKYDLIIPMWTQGQMDDRYAFHLAEAVESGVGLGGAHGGMCDSFRWNIEYQFMTGSQWVAHPGGSKYLHHIARLDDATMQYMADNYPDNSIPGVFQMDYKVEFKKNSTSPIIAGLEDFTVHTEQYYLHVDPCIDVLATTRVDSLGWHETNGPVEMPVIYTKHWGKGRVFYSSLGHQDNILAIPQVETFTRRGLLWAAR